MNINRKSSISLREQRRADERGRKQLGKSKIPVMRRMMALLTAVVFYSFTIAPSLNYFSLEASPVVPQLDTPEFNSQDITPFVDDAASAQNVAAWDGIVLQGISMLRTDWEEYIDQQIESHINSVSTHDQIHGTEEYRTYIRDSLELQREQALADWIQNAEDLIQEERDVFLNARSRLQIAEQEDDTDETVLNWELMQASYLEESERSYEITPNTIPDIFNRASDLLEIEQQAWERDYQDRLDFGNYEYSRALSQIEQEHDTFQADLNRAREVFEQNRQYIEQLETQVRNEIAHTVTVMEQELFLSPQFYRDYTERMSDCGQWSSAACENQRAVAQKNLNDRGQQLQSQLQSLQQSLQAGDSLSDLTRIMRDILNDYHSMAAERSDEWESRINGTVDYSRNEGGFEQTTDRVRTYKSSNSSQKTNRYYRKSSEDHGSEYYGGELKEVCAMTNPFGDGCMEYREVQAITSGLNGSVIDNRTCTVNYYGGGQNCTGVDNSHLLNKGSLRTTRLGETDTRLIWDQAEDDGNGNFNIKTTVIGNLLDSPDNWDRSIGHDIDWNELEQRSRIARILEYHRTGDASYVEGLLGDWGESREITGINHADVCGNGGGSRGTGSDCVSDAGSKTSHQVAEHAFVYGTSKKRKTLGITVGRNYYTYSQTSFSTGISYSFYDEHADENHDLWSTYSEELGSELSIWDDVLLPSIENWEQQRTEFEASFASWQNEAAAKEDAMDSWYERSRDQLLDSRDNWRQRMEDQHRQGRQQWNILNRDLEVTENNWQDRVEQANWRDEQVQATLRQELQAEMNDLMSAVPARVEAETGIETEMAAFRADMPALQQAFLKQGEEIPDTQALFDLVEQFSRAATAMMNAATVDSLNETIDEMREEPVEMALDMLNEEVLDLGDVSDLCDGFNMCQSTFAFADINVSDGSLTASRSILSGEGSKRSGKTGRRTHHYDPDFREQSISYYVDIGGSVGLSGPDSLFDGRNTGEMMQNFMTSMQEFQQSAMQALTDFQMDIARADAIVYENLNHYTEWTQREVEDSQSGFSSFMSSGFGQMISTALTVASFIPATAPFALVAQGVLATAQGFDEGGWKGGLAAGGSALLSHYTAGVVNVNYSHEDGWGGSVGANIGDAGGVGLSYSKDGGWGATAGIGIGDFQAGAAWNENDGVLGAELGYTGFDNMNLGLSYDAENGYGGSMGYNDGTYAGGLAYSEGQGLSGAASYTHHNDMGGYHRGDLAFDADGNYDIGLDSRFDAAYEVGRHVDSPWFEGAYSNSMVLDTRLGYSSEDGSYFDHDVNFRAATDNRIVANDERYTTCTVGDEQGVCQIRPDGMGPDHSTFQKTDDFMNAKLGCSGGQCEEKVDNFVGLGMNTNIRGTEATCTQLREENGGTCFGIENTTGINGIAAVTNAMGNDMTGQSDRWAAFMGDANDHMHEDTTSFFHSDGTSNYLLAAEKYQKDTDNALDLGGGDIHLAGTPLVNPLLGNSEEKLAQRLEDAGVSGDQVNTYVYGNDLVGGAGISLADHSEEHYTDYLFGSGDPDMASSNIGNDFDNDSLMRQAMGAGSDFLAGQVMDWAGGQVEDRLHLDSPDVFGVSNGEELPEVDIADRFGVAYEPGKEYDSYAEELGIERRDFYQQQSAQNAATVGGWAEDGATAILESKTLHNLASLIGQEDALQEQIDDNLAGTIANLANEEAYDYLNDDIRDHIEEESSFWGEEEKLVMPGVIP